MNKTSIVNFCVNKPFKLMIFFLTLTILSSLAIFKIPVQLMPNIKPSTVSIKTNVRGGMPANQVERIITIPLEKELSAISGIKDIHSASKNSESLIILNFNRKTDINTKILEVNQIYEKIKPDLPREIDTPIIAKYNQYDTPIYIISIHSKTKTQEELRQIAETSLKQKFMRLQGVANLEIAGGRERHILIALSEKKLQHMQLSVNDIIRNISRNNANIVTGKIKNKNNAFALRTNSLYTDLSEIENIVVHSAEHKDIVTLKDIATVKYDYKEQIDLSRINGKKNVSLYLQKQSDANTLKVCYLINKTVQSVREEYKDQFAIETVSNKALFITKSLKELLFALSIGIILAFLIIFYFLRNKKLTLIVCLSLPLSLVFSIAALYLWGFSLNINSITGLCLGVGMLIDSAIVVSENIFKEAKNTKDFKQAIINATSAMFTPLTASTLSTIIVFVPLIMADPRTKALYAPLALAVVFSLMFSLLISLFLLPALISRFVEQKNEQKKTTKNIFLKKLHKQILLKILKKPKQIITCLVALFCLGVLFLYMIPKDIAAAENENKFTVFAELKSGAKLEVANKTVTEIENILKGVKEIKKTIVRIERWSGKIYVTLHDNLKVSTKTIMKRCDQLLKNAGTKQHAFVYLSQSENSSADEITLNIYGFKYPDMLKAAGTINETLKQRGNFFNFKYRYKPGRPEKKIIINRIKAAKAGFTVKDIADILHAKLKGLIATEIFEEGKEQEVIVRLSETDRYDLDDILNVQINNPNGENIPLKTLMTLQDGKSPSQIWHLNKKRLIQLQFATDITSTEEAVKKVKKLLQSINLPKGCFYEFGHDYIELKKSYNALKTAVVIMLLLIYMLLASVFENYTEPLKIMLTLPFAVLGIAIAVLFTGMHFSLGSLNGVIILGGICVNNAIIMTDCFNEFKRKFKSSIKASIYTAHKRLRPIMMTTLTTILGLLPLSFNTNTSAAIYRDMAITVIMGLTFSTLIILFVFPLILGYKRKDKHQVK